MGYMKKIVGVLIALFIVSGFVSNVGATEGSFDIKGSGVACKATSVWHESRYRVIGRCDGLVYPFQTAYEYYSVWAHNPVRNTYIHIDDVDRGYFEDSVTEPFDKILITAEQDASPRKPSTYQIAVGTVTKFAFDKSDAEIPTEQVTAKTGTTMTVQGDTAKTASTAGSVVGKILKSFLVIVLVIVVIVVVGSLIFRKRGSVSA